MSYHRNYRENRNDKYRSKHQPAYYESTENISQELFEKPDAYVSYADTVIQELRSQEDGKKFSTSKIRNILSMVTDIYNDIIRQSDDKLSNEIQDRITSLRIRLVYECGREPKIIRPFVEKARLLDWISFIGDSRARFIHFSRYMEALVAYHRYHGGKD